MNGKVIGIILILSGLTAGIALYYLQIYGFYEEISDGPEANVQLVSSQENTPLPIAYEEFRAIDADSSPIRYRACFQTNADLSALEEVFVVLEDQTPRNAPGWFDCFDAANIAAELDAQTARTFLGEKNVRYGVDRIVAITDDGRGYVWHELNDCGEDSFGGTDNDGDCPSVKD